MGNRGRQWRQGARRKGSGNQVTQSRAGGEEEEKSLGMVSSRKVFGWIRVFA